MSNISDKSDQTLGHVSPNNTGPIRDCKCGGTVGFDTKQLGIIHSLPTCARYDDLDLMELIKTRGALALAVHGMWKGSAEA